MRSVLPLLFLLSCVPETEGVQAPPPSPPEQVVFEAGPVRPITLTPSGDKLIVTNMPDHRIEVFDVGPDGVLTHDRDIVVGMVPVAVAARSDNEVWVVNHLSDSISIVDLSLGAVTRTLLVGDEPRDIVFASNGLAFITAARRGQHLTDPSLASVPGAGDPMFTTPGEGRAHVWVFDPDDLGDTVGGTPRSIVTLFGDTPRGLATSPNGRFVYAAILHSGNRTSVVREDVVCDVGDAMLDPVPGDACVGDGEVSPGGLAGGALPGFMQEPIGPGVPEASVIVRQGDDGVWRDAEGRNWSNGVRFDLPDQDIFAIDSRSLTVRGSAQHVGTTLFNVAVNPVNGTVYVSNTDANNLDRFEGRHTTEPSLRGELAKARISLIDPRTGTVTPRRLNSHLTYDPSNGDAGKGAHSLAIPLEMAVHPDGQTVYVAAYGSSKVGVLSAAALEGGTLDPLVDSADYFSVQGGGPGGLVLSDDGSYLYVYTRFDNGVSAIRTLDGTETHYTMFTPEPQHVIEGREILYNAVRDGSNGETSCASCHIFGDTDHLSWNLGDPGGTAELDLIPARRGGPGNMFVPLKGPMFTQSLRGMRYSGALHWRGDRSVGTTDVFSADQSFINFDVAFDGLLGDPTTPDRTTTMQTFSDFAMSLSYPPNPVRPLDNNPSDLADVGVDFYFGTRPSDGIIGVSAFTCNDCHRVDPGVGFFGTDGFTSEDGETQRFKIPHLRNLYTRVGMFGLPRHSGMPIADNEHMGDQIRGFGFIHDGSIDSLVHFFQGSAFRDNMMGVGFETDLQRDGITQYLLEFDNDVPPITGQQISNVPALDSVMMPRMALMASRAQVSFDSAMLGGLQQECDFVVHYAEGGRQVGWRRIPGTFLMEPDDTTVAPMNHNALRLYLLAEDIVGTATCLPPGTGAWVLDRDGDGVFNGDEVAAGTDPADPTSF